MKTGSKEKGFEQSVRARAVDLRTYLRPKDTEGSSFETRSEMLWRSVHDHHQRLWLDAGGTPDEDELLELFALASAGQSAVAGRAQWLGGTPYAYERACCQYNCAYNEVATVFDLVNTAWLLLNGCGVGFKPRVGTLHGYARHIDSLEVVPSTNDRDHRGPDTNDEQLPCADNEYTWTIRVGDSAQAWAKAVGKMFAPRALAARKLVIDGSRIRGAGGRLKGYGWICNGFAPLAKAMTAMHHILNASAGGLLDEIQIMDVVNWLGTVLSSRRAAELCVLDSHSPRVREFERAKRNYWEGNPQRRQSNNTEVFWSKPSRGRVEELLHAAHECGGDPAIANGEAALRKAPWFSGFNPCVPADTWVLTSTGPAQVVDLVGKPFFALVDGQEHDCPTGFFPTGTRPVRTVRLRGGVLFRATDNHRVLVVTHQTQKVQRTEWLEAGQLKPGDLVVLHNHRGAIFTGAGTDAKGWLLGNILGGGGKLASMASVCAHVATDGLTPPTVRIGPSPLGNLTGEQIGQTVKHTSSAFHAGFLRGWFDAAGSVQGSRREVVSVLLTSVSLDHLRVAQCMLARLGVIATIRDDKRQDQQVHKLVITRDNVRVFADRVGFDDPTRRARLARLLSNHKRRMNRERFCAAVESIEDGGVEPVYDCTVPGPHAFDANGCYLHNCAEILLARNGFCNLVTNCLPRFKRNLSAMQRAVYLIARANYRQTCVDLKDGVLTPEWDQTNAALRLCGVSATGVVQADWLTDSDIRRLRNSAVAGAWSMADELRLPRPKAVTTLKPEGTQSKTLGGPGVGEIAEGIHRPLGRYIFNWINFSVHDPVVAILESAGYRTLPNPSDHNNVLVCFPVEYRGVTFDRVAGKDVNLEPATVQLDRYLRWNNLWADHNVSCTVSYSPQEIPLIADWIDRNWDAGFIAVSFLLRADPTKTAADLGHPYLPQEVVDEGVFRAYEARLREPDFSSARGIYEIDEVGCATGACPVR